MKNKVIKILGFCCTAFTLSAVMSSCGSESEEVIDTESQYTYLLTTNVRNTAPGHTRALEYKDEWVKVEGQNQRARKIWFDSRWKAGDNMYVNISDLTATVTTDTEGKQTDFTGKIKSEKLVQSGDQLIFTYPGNLPISGKTVTVDLSKQDGRLDVIGKQMDLQWGQAKARVESNNKINAQVDLKHQMAFLGLYIFGSINDPKNTGICSWSDLKDPNDINSGYRTEHIIDSVKIKGVNTHPKFDMLFGKFTTPCTDQQGVISIDTVRQAYGKAEFPDYDPKEPLFLYIALMPGTYESLTVQMDVDNTNTRYQLVFPLKNVVLKPGAITHLQLDEEKATRTELGDTELRNY